MFLETSRVVAYTEAELSGGRGCHFPDADGNLARVDEKRDGNTLQAHLDGIAYLGGLLRDGVKLMPILVAREPDGTLRKLDGFKRLMAAREQNEPLIEAFVCDPEDMGKSFTYEGLRLHCYQGGQRGKWGWKAHGPVEYGEAVDQSNGSGKIHYLFKGRSLRLEYREAIHLHWGPRGKYRLMLGRRDLELLADAFEDYGKAR